ncbi:hypothetical protein DJ030_06280 [bacterium endosymbiont of Escarpia laminata]|nr:MAG: hypothetical protein DJ030_06280 [bacterium endosymbiont of Escarpia laminata]
MRYVHDGGMKIIMKLEDLKTIDQLTDFLSGTQAVAFSVFIVSGIQTLFAEDNGEERTGWIAFNGVNSLDFIFFRDGAHQLAPKPVN